MKTVTLADLRQHLGQVVKRIEEGEEIALTRRGVVVATLAPPKEEAQVPSRKPKEHTKADWARWLREHPPVKRKKPLTAEQTAEFLEALKRDF